MQGKTSLVARSAPLRRNGRPQACEPCHRRKVACDHQLPCCSRCKKGNIISKCIYKFQSFLVTPGPSVPHTPSFTSSGGSLQRSPPHQHHGLPPPPLSTSSSSSSSSSIPQHRAPSPRDRRITARKRKAEDGGSSDTEGQTSETAHPSLVSPSSQEWYTSELALDESLKVKAADVLSNMPSKRDQQIIDSIDHDLYEGGCHLLGRCLQAFIWPDIGKTLSALTRPSGIQEMAAHITRNTVSPLRDDIEDPREWHESFSGANVRWESLGVMFTHWAFQVCGMPQHLPQSDANGLAGEKYRKDLVAKFTDKAFKCVDLARAACPGTGNHLLLYVLYKLEIISSMIHGDSSFAYWRAHAETISMLTFLQYHHMPTAVNERSIHVQIKRRLAAACFKMDKVAAMLTGRPHLLGRKFYSTPLPLDVPDEVLLGDIPWEVVSLDENGWNTDGKVTATTKLRARTLMMAVREGILEIVLTNSKSVDRQTLFNLRDEALSIWSQLPPALIFQRSSLSSPVITSATLFAQLLTRMDHLQSLFFVERLLQSGNLPHKQAYPPTHTEVHMHVERQMERDGEPREVGVQPSKDLLNISHEMMNLALMLWTHQSRLKGAMEGDYEWLVMSYAAPAGGVMCMELLRRGGQGGLVDDRGISKSEIVQQLSLLVGFLDWVGSNAPNGELCYSVKTVVKKVLDDSLNGRLEAAGEVVGANADADERSTTEELRLSSEGGGGMEGWDELFNFGLLDTFEWVRPDG